MWWDLFIRTGIPPRQLQAMLTLSEVRDLKAYCNRFPITDEANLQIPQARMYATYLNVHRQQGVPAHEISEFIIGYPEESEEEDSGEMLMRRWKDW